ncbi:hypothetical protein QFW77_11535 [Luteimonas sp. RD2P54]|uniref:Uncharacterized protein n=1 Tax=Luteimonas endophytica TaxID=3042023 RepID=A0ABT6J9W9_9GAMM|nr:hypothetical protein [Luteimonas endophytica]MDH5823619.1 hypothetical protein [Luteimonas endophytica]
MSRRYRLDADVFLDHGITSGPTLPDRSVLAGRPVDPATLPALTYEVDVPHDAPCPHFMTVLERI